jgi:hypothetical protein
MLQVFIIILYENVFQNPVILNTQLSLSPEQSTLLRAMHVVLNNEKIDTIIGV